jgi:tetratricopeptide (TPR) repeat protein
MDAEAYEAIRKRVEQRYQQRYAFYTHLAVYTLVNIVLWLIYGATAGVAGQFSNAPVIGTLVPIVSFPWPLTTDYYPPMIPVVGWGDPRAMVGALLLISACAFGVAGMRKRNMAGFGLLWSVITYSVVSNVFINLGTPMNERFLFMPSAGFALVLAALFVLALDRVRSSLAVGIARSLVALVLVGFAAQIFSRNRDWHDDLTLFAHDVTVSDRSARCHVMYAKLLVEAAGRTRDEVQKNHRLSDARKHLERGLAIYPYYALAHGLLGKLAMDRKDYRMATEHYIACLERDPTEEVALKNLSFIGRRMGEVNDVMGAERAFRAAIRFAPHATEPYLFLADALMRTGRADSSIVLLDHLTGMKSDYADAYRLKGEVYAVYLKQPALAAENFLKAHELDPNNTSVTDNLGVAAFKRQDYPRALSFFLEGIKAKPDDAQRLRNVSETYRMLGDGVKAEEFLRRAIEREGR